MLALRLEVVRAHTLFRECGSRCHTRRILLAPLQVGPMRRVSVNLTVFLWNDIKLLRRDGPQRLLILRYPTHYTTLSVANATRIFELQVQWLYIVNPDVSKAAVDVVELEHEEVGLILG